MVYLEQDLTLNTLFTDRLQAIGGDRCDRSPLEKLTAQWFVEEGKLICRWIAT
jgi:hypothetical protein